MAHLYGNPISDEEQAELVRRLRNRGTDAAARAATALGGGANRHATIESAEQVRQLILRELQDWAELDETSPRLAAVRDRLAAPPQGLSRVF
jgi:hypothetical protein